MSTGIDNLSYASDQNDSVIEMYKNGKNSEYLTDSRPPTRQRSNIAEPVSLSWHNIDVFNKISSSKLSCFKKNNKKPSVHILKNVSGQTKPGQLLAIMGSSGAGKTTLMNVLTRRNLSLLDVKGVVKLNGKTANVNDLIALSAYVQQDDLFIGTLTVREHLQFACEVRMEQHISKTEKQSRIDQVLVELGLSKCADTIIGWPGSVKGISGGEMKRLAFASELLTNPSLMFCDEPTSGLDSFMAQSVVEVLKDLAATGRTIVCTIHQPSSDVFTMFDQLLLMADGRVAYMGSLKNSLEYFSSLGLHCPNNFNPADFYIKQLAIIPGNEDECKNKVKEICDKFVGTSYAREAMPEQIQISKDEINTQSMVYRSRYKASWWSQFRALLWRSFFSVTREPLISTIRILQTVIIAILLGLIYLRQDLDQNGIMNINGAIFLLITQMNFQNVFAVTQTFCMELPIFLREHNNGMYRVDAYFLTKMLAELPTFIIVPTLFVLIFYFLVGLNSNPGAFFICLLIAIIFCNCSCSFGYFISCISSSISMAMSIGPPVLVPLLIFGGFFLNNASVPVYFIWLKYISWFYYGNELLMINQWRNIDHIECEMQTNNPNNTSSLCLLNGQMVLNYYNFHEEYFVRDLLLLIAIMVVLRILAYTSLLIRSRKR